MTFPHRSVRSPFHPCIQHSAKPSALVRWACPNLQLRLNVKIWHSAHLYCGPQCTLQTLQCVVNCNLISGAQAYRYTLEVWSLSKGWWLGRCPDKPPGQMSPRLKALRTGAPLTDAPYDKCPPGQPHPLVDWLFHTFEHWHLCCKLLWHTRNIKRLFYCIVVYCKSRHCL